MATPHLSRPDLLNRRGLQLCNIAGERLNQPAERVYHGFVRTECFTYAGTVAQL